MRAYNYKLTTKIS